MTAPVSSEKVGRNTQLTSKKNSHVIRWYVLVLPSCHRGAAPGLEAELERRARYGEPSFEFFAPSYVEVKEVKNRLVKTNRPLLYNYIFIKSSEYEIYRLKQQLPYYNFLPRVRDGKRDYYPYLSDEAMKNLQWVARSYANVVPVYTPEPDRLMEGDKVRITDGAFKGAEATVIVQPGAGTKDVMVCVDNCMWVPLLKVQPGQYEVVALNTRGKHVYTRLNNDRLLDALHVALSRYYADNITEQDKALATEILQQYGQLQMDSDVMRSRLYSFLLPAYIILGNKEESNRLISTIQALLPLITAEQSRALLLVTLYGCTDSSIYHEQAHALIDVWRKEQSPKKSKARLLQWLDDYDRWLGHL